MKTRTVSIFFGLIFLIVAGCQTEDYTVGKTAAAPPPVGLNAEEPGAVDSLFVREALAGGVHEIELSRLGLQRANNLDLKLLAQKIFDDHNRALKELERLVYLEKIPMTEKPHSTADFSALEKLSGPAFDRAYLRYLRDAHEDNIKVFQSAARNAHNDEVRTFAGRILPLLREHIRIAENISNMTDYGEDVNEPAGAERPREKLDPFYQGDPKIRHQFNPKE